MFPLLLAAGAWFVLTRPAHGDPIRVEALPEEPLPEEPLPEESVDQEELVQLGRDAEVGVVTDEERKVDRRIAATGLSLVSAVVATVYPPMLIVTLGSALYSTKEIFRRAYDSIVHKHRLSMPVMGATFFIGQYAGGYFVIAAAGLMVYHLSEKLLLKTQDRSQRNMIDSFSQQPRTVWVSINGIEVEVPIESVRDGDTVVVQAGEVVPIDGVIVQGYAAIDQHILTGDSQPAEKAAGDQVLRSTLMVGGKIYVQVQKTGEETVAAQIGAILSTTASYQASIVSKGERFADTSVAPTMLLALVALPIAGYPYMVTVLGSAIGLNIRLTAPIAMLNFLNVAAREGVLIKDARSLELLHDVDTVVFDKTGTLTLEQPQIVYIHTCAEVDADSLLTYAAAAEHRQTHPVARAIQAEARKRRLSLVEVDQERYEMGFGLCVRVDGHVIRVGSEGFMSREDIEIHSDIQAAGRAAREKGHALVMVARDGWVIGAVELETVLRPEMEAVVDELRRHNLDIWIISGDQEAPTREIAQRLDIRSYVADTLPEEKGAVIEQLQAEGRRVCFVGDGINDSVAMKRAQVSISLRGASTAAMDTAQMVLMGEGLQQLPFVFEVARAYGRNMNAGFAVAVSQGAIVIGGALLGVVGIVTGKVIWAAGLAVGLAIAEVPILWRRSTLERYAAIMVPRHEIVAVAPAVG